MEKNKQENSIIVLEKYIAFPDGTRLEAVPYPETVPETECIVCGAQSGQPHDFGCELEECPRCGDQLVHCGCLGE